jgi:AcrR family transcriptional regulator
MKNKPDTSQKILEAALKEFSLDGFKGTRVDNIAKRANINKAMIFYYFSSKRKLYNAVLKNVMLKIFGKISDLLNQEDNAQMFFQKLSEIYISFLAENQDFVRIVILDSIHNPKNIHNFFNNFFRQRHKKGPGMLFEKIKKWQSSGEIIESDPLQLIINIVSLNIFIFVGKSIFEAIFNIKIDEVDDFYKNRIKSVVELIKRGMIK